MGGAEPSHPPENNLTPNQLDPLANTVRTPECHNPDPVVQLIGPPNKVQVEVNGVTTYALIDARVQITTIVYSFVRQLQLEIHDLNEVIRVEEAGGFTVPYSGYFEVNLRIPQFPQYEETIWC